MNDEQLRGLFGEMRDEPIPGDSLARVRMAVVERLEARRRRVAMSWKIAAMLAVCGGLTAVVWPTKTAIRIQAPPALVKTPAAVVEQAVPGTVKPVVRKVVHRVVHRKIPAAPIEGGANEIRIESPLEPDVVIVLIGG